MYLFQDRSEDARNAYGEAIGVIQKVAGNLTDPVLRETFLTSNAIREIMTKADYQ
jgi:hypothetical protein